MSTVEDLSAVSREVPVLRREFAALRPAGVPDNPPTHASMKAAVEAGETLPDNTPIVLAS